jgi:hypothetical protein
MINHARTLLLNQSRQRTHYSDVGYEYVPPEFRPVDLPPTLALVRQLLFGSAPDNYFLNYRCRELLSCIHTTDLADYVYKFDPRVTYWPEKHKPFFEPTSKRVSITQIYGLPQRFNVTGNLRSLNALGHANRQYTIDLYRITNESDEVVLQLKIQTLGNRLPPTIMSVTSFDTPPIVTLPQTEVRLRPNFKIPPVGDMLLLDERNSELEIETYTPRTETAVAAEPIINRQITTDGDAITFIEIYAPASENQTSGLVARWFVETTVTPDPILPTAIAALEMIGEPASLELFGFDNKEPYLTFKNLWFDHPLPTYRLAGIVLALIYRTEELRRR